MSQSSDNTEGCIDEILNIVEPPNCDTEEDVLFQESAILFRFSPEISEWVTRGTGIIKILKSHKTGHHRILMRQNQTYRVCANHHVPYFGKLLEKNNSNREFIWTTFDFADEPEVREIFAIRFSLPEIAKSFKIAFEQARDFNFNIYTKK